MPDVNIKYNPFQVYPVRGLFDLADVTEATVRTPEVEQVDRAVRQFVEGFGNLSDPPNKLLLAAKGDFGTGKTHLMLYARSLLISEINQLHPSDPDRPGEMRAPITVMTASTEAPIEDWFASDLGPTLIESASPRELVRELLTQIACKIAVSDPDPDIKLLADTFRASRKNLYEIFRDPGEFDISEVEAQFNTEIAAACRRTSGSFRRVVEALRWEETAELAEDWLAGNELSAAETGRINVRLGGDRATRAANAICVIASLSLRVGRPFALFLDEFEHLARYDHRNHSKRNITWTKRLVESLARRGAMVFISGHWEAWAQQDDFLDRFVGGRPIQLVRLSGDDVMKVVEVRAPHWPGFTAAAAEAVVEETSGNIRRVMTVLYDLWSDPSAPTAGVTHDAVRLAALRRLQPGSEIGIMPTIEAAVRAHGAVMSRNETFGQPPAPVDAVAHLETELRLIVKIIHARDELALINGSEKFARLVKDARTNNPQARGLCITLGAVITKHVLTLDAAFPELDLVNGEEPGIVERLPEIVARALAPAPEPALPPTTLSLQELEEIREDVIQRAETQIERSRELFGKDIRSEAVRQTAVADPEELARQRQALSMSRASIVIGIHGLANKPPFNDKIGYWREALIEGLKRNCGKTTDDLSFDFVYWADLRYQAPIAFAGNPEPYYEDPGTGPFPAYQASKWAEIINAATEIVGTEVNLLDMHTGVTSVGDFVLERELRDLAAYYNDAQFRETVRTRLRDKLKQHKGSRIMLIGHSMGSIIAYDVLRRLGRDDPQFRVDHFVTIGSPLGMPHVKYRIQQENDLVRTPSIVGRWTNFADRRDVVAIDAKLGDDYEPNDQGVKVTDVPVINAYRSPLDRDPPNKPNYHKSYGYLRTPEMSSVVRAFR
jgi:hypothetical protein